MLPIIENAKKEILDALSGSGDSVAGLIAAFRTSFEEWKLPWTQTRAEQLDRILPVQRSVEGIPSIGIFDKYDVKKTPSVSLTTALTDYLNVTGEAVLIAYALSNPSNSTGVQNGVNVRTIVDNKVMYNIGHRVNSGSANGRSEVTAPFFLSGSIDSGRTYELDVFSDHIAPSTSLQIMKDEYGTFRLFTVPTSASSLSIQASKVASFTDDIKISIIYGVRK